LVEIQAEQEDQPVEAYRDARTLPCGRPAAAAPVARAAPARPRGAPPSSLGEARAERRPIRSQANRPPRPCHSAAA
jgi:hypothetical protein